MESLGAVGAAADFAAEAAEVAADDADVVVDAEDGGAEVDGIVTLAEHEFQFLDLGVADGGHGPAELRLTGGAVDQEAIDVG